MEDSIAQYIKAAEDLRGLIREAHEVLRDLRTEAASTRNLIKKFEIEATERADARVKETEKEIWTKLKGDVLSEFIANVDKAVEIIHSSVDKHNTFIADQADTLATAMQLQSPSGVRAVGAIARDLSVKRRLKEAQRKGKLPPGSAET